MHKMRLVLSSLWCLAGHISMFVGQLNCVCFLCLEGHKLGLLSFSPLFLPPPHPIHSSFFFLSSVKTYQGVEKGEEWVQHF